MLTAEEHDNVFVGETVDGASAQTSTDRVVFLFPGQGAQHIGMARDLYDSGARVRQAFRRCVAGFGRRVGHRPEGGDLRRQRATSSATDRTQPALFTVQRAGKLLESYGIRRPRWPGHSIGEYAAATIAGVFDLPTAIKVVAMRAWLMHTAPRGVMV